MAISRREFTRLLAASGAFAAATQLGRSAALAQTTGYRAMVGIFLFGGNDAWNMVVPTDGRYAAYAAGRGAALALPQSSLVPLTGSGLGLHPSFAPLKAAWSEGALNAVVNVGSLFQPLTKASYQANPAIRPLNLMSHADEQNHWQGVRMRDVNTDGFMGRLNDRIAPAATPSLISLAGSTLALIGDQTSPLILPSTGAIVRNGYNGAATDAPTVARQAAIGAFSDASAYGTVTNLSAQGISSAYAQAATANGILTATTSVVDQYFKNPATGTVLTSDISRQLLRVARMIEARGALGHTRQTFFASQGGYDTHSNQVDAANTTTGTQANLYADLAMAMAAFYQATKALGVAGGVTTFTMSDFGRTYKVNAQRGTDHAWGNNHLVMGAALKPQAVYGAYPDVTLGGSADIDGAGLGRWIPTIAIEQYIGAVAQWQGVSAADLPYVFPNWATWSTGGRAPLPLFG